MIFPPPEMVITAINDPYSLGALRQPIYHQIWQVCKCFIRSDRRGIKIRLSIVLWTYDDINWLFAFAICTNSASYVLTKSNAFRFCHLGNSANLNFQSNLLTPWIYVDNQRTQSHHPKCRSIIYMSQLLVQHTFTVLLLHCVQLASFSSPRISGKQRFLFPLSYFLRLRVLGLYQVVDLWKVIIGYVSLLLLLDCFAYLHLARNWLAARAVGWFWELDGTLNILWVHFPQHRAQLLVIPAFLDILWDSEPRLLMQGMAHQLSNLLL